MVMQRQNLFLGLCVFMLYNECNAMGQRFIDPYAEGLARLSDAEVKELGFDLAALRDMSPYDLLTQAHGIRNLSTAGELQQKLADFKCALYEEVARGKEQTSKDSARLSLAYIYKYGQCGFQANDPRVVYWANQLTGDSKTNDLCRTRAYALLGNYYREHDRDYKNGVYSTIDTPNLNDALIAFMWGADRCPKNQPVLKKNMEKQRKTIAKEIERQSKERARQEEILQQEGASSSQGRGRINGLLLWLIRQNNEQGIEMLEGQ